VRLSSGVESEVLWLSLPLRLNVFFPLQTLVALRPLLGGGSSSFS